ncbi:response regulator [Alteromonas oceanisediminis]|uniref:response regulator n=1 Tax=Alteromonas oceanisediminis TaxID=2836180 RepID=UPI001BDAAAAE|nr:response regulator [Alteromonas oceanisediminis]MBT0587205.1 response regulator [Alteromonas oceanisediminis]
MLLLSAHLAWKRAKTMTVKTRLAIVEDNASARIHLRSHLLALGNLDIFSFSNGQELKSALRTQSMDIVVFDFHLGQHKNGVEWVQSLQKAGLLKPSTGVIFVTSDQTPQTIGQIIDLQPDFLIIKPYTIRTIKQIMQQYLSIRRLTLGILERIDKGELAEALRELDDLIANPKYVKQQVHLLKLSGKLLLQNQQYDKALALYQSVLKRSDRVIWARWGLVKSLFMRGDWQRCQQQISHLLDIQLTQNKAYEWLACIEFEQHNYAQAERWLDNIKLSELTLQAVRLKSMTYEMLERIDDAIALLEKKRQTALSVREHREELTFELADYHIKNAAAVNLEQRKEDLYKARCLIGNAGRSTGDRQIHQRRDYMLSLANLLEGETERAKRLLENDWMHNFSRSEVNTMLIAAQVWQGVGDAERAQLILQECESKIAGLGDQVEQSILQTLLISNEKQLNNADDLAMQYNQRGNDAFIAGRHHEALACFYKAYRLAASIPAFAINLLQCMVKHGLSSYRGTYTLSLVEDLQEYPLSQSNRQRLNEIKRQIASAPTAFTPKPDDTGLPDVGAEESDKGNADLLPSALH